MGLFNDIGKLVKKAAADKLDDAVSAAASTKAGQAAMRSKERADLATGRVCPAQIALWDTSMRDREPVLLEPLYEGKMFVYYPEPLRAVRDGERFRLEAIAGDVVMTSSYNGTRSSTVELESVAYMYEGRPVGMSRYFRETVTELLRGGRRVIVEAEKRGVYDKNVPEVVIFGNRDTRRVLPL